MKVFDEIFVSIIIPTYRDWDRMKLCVDALLKQRYPKDHFEVIIVNNDPEDAAPDDLRLPENFYLVCEHKSGSYTARNRGIKLAKGNILGFTDSDCLPHEDWIYNAVTLFRQKNCDRIAGNIEIFCQNEYKPTNVELYERVFAFKQRETVRANGVCVTGNMFTRKEVFDGVGTFNESLFSGGDYEWGTRAVEKGFNIVYDEDVKIYHPARSTMSELMKKAKRVGGGTGKLLTGNKKKNAVTEYLGTFEPAKFAAYMIKNYGKEMSPWQKLKVFVIRFYFRHTMNLEKVKVAFGKQANRA